jgi:hypothetical protein
MPVRQHARLRGGYGWGASLCAHDEQPERDRELGKCATAEPFSFLADEPPEGIRRVGVSD